MNDGWFDRKPWHVAHPNVLLEGSDAAIEAGFAELWPWLSEPVHVCSLPGPLVLPDATTGAVILRDVARLAPSQQDEFLRWIDEPSRSVQVVSATSARLFSQVEQGAFSEGLYYRLNIVREELGART